MAFVFSWGLLTPQALLASAEEAFSLVINNGRVINPEAGPDAIRHVGIRQGRVAVISPSPLDGAQTIDGTSLLVAPGFTDIYSSTA